MIPLLILTLTLNLKVVLWVFLSVPSVNIHSPPLSTAHLLCWIFQQTCMWPRCWCICCFPDEAVFRSNATRVKSWCRRQECERLTHIGSSAVSANVSSKCHFYRINARVTSSTDVSLGNAYVSPNRYTNYLPYHPLSGAIFGTIAQAFAQKGEIFIGFQSDNHKDVMNPEDPRGNCPE